MSVRGVSRSEFHDLASQILQSGYGVRFKANGGSMQPFILDGDILEVAPLAEERVRLGDVLLVETLDGYWLAHRVVKIGHQDSKPAYFIKGDACPHPDGWFEFEHILGRVVAVDHGNQRVELTSGAQALRARLWVTIAPWIPKVSWLPKRSRQYLRQILFGKFTPD